MKATDLIPRDYGPPTFQWGPHLQLPGQGTHNALLRRQNHLPGAVFGAGRT